MASYRFKEWQWDIAIVAVGEGLFVSGRRSFKGSRSPHASRVRGCLADKRNPQNLVLAVVGADRLTRVVNGPGWIGDLSL